MSFVLDQQRLVILRDLVVWKRRHALLLMYGEETMMCGRRTRSRHRESLRMIYDDDDIL